MATSIAFGAVLTVVVVLLNMPSLSDSGEGLLQLMGAALEKLR